MFKEFCIKCLHALYRIDEWINELYTTAGTYMDKTKERIQIVYNNIFFDTLNEYGCEIFEKDLDIIPKKGSTLEERRKAIKSKWLAKTFCNLPLLQKIADNEFGEKKLLVSYYGDAELTYTTKGLPPREEVYRSFVSAIDRIKPAHFGYRFEHLFNLWGDYLQMLTWRLFLSTGLWRWKLLTKWIQHIGSHGGKTWEYCNSRTWDEHLWKEID